MVLNKLGQHPNSATSAAAQGLLYSHTNVGPRIPKRCASSLSSSTLTTTSSTTIGSPYSYFPLAYYNAVIPHSGPAQIEPEESKSVRKNFLSYSSKTETLSHKTADVDVSENLVTKLHASKSSFKTLLSPCSGVNDSGEQLKTSYTRKLCSATCPSYQHHIKYHTRNITPKPKSLPT